MKIIFNGITTSIDNPDVEREILRLVYRSVAQGSHYRGPRVKHVWTPEQVESIFTRYLRGEANLEKLAKEFGVTTKSVTAVLYRRNITKKDFGSRLDYGQ